MLRACLLEHRLREGQAGIGFAFGGLEGPFNPAAVRLARAAGVDAGRALDGDAA